MTDHDQFRVRLVYLSAFFVLMALLASACDGRAATATSIPTPVPESAAIEVSEAGFPDSLLNSDADGASVWIEYPIQGQILLDKAVTFVVYASAAGGVEAINLTLNGESLPGGSLTDLSNDGDGSMVRLESTWQPPGHLRSTWPATCPRGSPI